MCFYFYISFFKPFKSLAFIFEHIHPRLAITAHLGPKSFTSHPIKASPTILTLPKMPHYYMDSSYYRYSVPAQREDTSYYYHSTSAHLIDTSQYSFSVPDATEHAYELEAYAESAANRTYTWDEIHPAYHDQPTDNYYEPTQLPVDDEEDYEDVTDEELAEMNRRCMEYQKQLAERKVKEVNETRTVEVLRGEDQEDHDDKYKGDPEDIMADYSLPPLLPPHPEPIPTHHIFYSDMVAASPQTTLPPHPHLPLPDIPDIHIPIPHPLAPNIWCMSHPHHHQHLPNYNPPDILAPLPLPCKPNIHHRYFFKL